MKNTFRKITALTLSILTVASLASCNKDKPEDISDSQESSLSEKTEDGKTIITIGMPGMNQLLLPSVNDFNNKNENYHLEIIDYSKGIKDDDIEGTKALNALKMALATDEAPDIIGLHPAYIAELLQKDMFTDMYALMDSCEGVKREDFLPNVLEGFEVNGEIPAISNCFVIGTAVAKTKFVGEECENWTPQQAIDAYNKYSDSMDFLPRHGDENIFHDFMLKKAVQSSVDLSTYTCNFMNSEFITLLDFIGKADFTTYIPDYEKMTAEENHALAMDSETAYINDKTLISTSEIRGIGQVVANWMYSGFGGEAVTFVGYPSEDGNGAVTRSVWMYAISEKSQNKEAAWEFINSLFSEEAMEEIYETTEGIPVLTEYLDRQKNNKDKEDYRSIYNKLYVPGSNFEEGMYITEDVVQKLYDYILSVKFEPYTDWRIEEIIDEECAAAIAGEKSAEEVAEILDSRLGIYLSERS
ncbi:MAG: extracellular solute-binding protein [Ruminococcus sp.]|nr:extracellular solute-binding protein [Ruminococcus sp.]